MPELRFAIESTSVVQYAAIPTISFQVRINNSTAEEVIHTIALRAQIQIEANRRRYEAGEQAQLLDLFGAPERWGQTVRSLLWTHATAMVPHFMGTTLAELPVPSTTTAAPACAAR